MMKTDGVKIMQRPACRHSTTFRGNCDFYTVSHILCFMANKNITLAVDGEVLAAVRRHAAEHNSTVNALVRAYLENLAAHADRARRARKRLRQLSLQSQGQLGAKTWTREELHDR